jgi:hypothetical protein
MKEVKLNAPPPQVHLTGYRDIKREAGGVRNALEKLSFVLALKGHGVDSECDKKTPKLEKKVLQTFSWPKIHETTYDIKVVTARKAREIKMHGYKKRDFSLATCLQPRFTDCHKKCQKVDVKKSCKTDCSEVTQVKTCAKKCGTVPKEVCEERCEEQVPPKCSPFCDNTVTCHDQPDGSKACLAGPCMMVCEKQEKPKCNRVCQTVFQDLCEESCEEHPQKTCRHVCKLEHRTKCVSECKQRASVRMAGAASGLSVPLLLAALLLLLGIVF